MPDAFIDTNIFLYAVSDDPSEAPKKERALRLISSTDFAISVQVI